MIDILLIILALLASAYFSANEIAFVVANKIKLEVRAKKNIFGAQSAKKLIRNPSEFLTTFLIGNNIANITFASFSGIYLRYVFNLSDFETLLITTTILLIFGEIIPKAITREMADIAILYFSFPNKFIRFILLPLIKLIELI
ncbi:MAG: DUF21 domain-containing protein, partial [Ignavibacteria bacterium]|nr:DUF21 domain-containing protein [Ignavibacteria bacterium]